ncbi:uncharacterized protein LOC144821591 isoform X4 [Lissotriton helveticus]
MSEASSGGIQTCASQVKIKEIEEASTSDEQIFMARVEVKGDMTTSSDWRDDIQQVVIGEASGSDCQAYESHTKFENRMQTSSNHWGYNQHVIEESEEVAASDPPSYLNPVKIKEGKEAFSHDGQHDMETERVEEASPNEHHASVSHIKLEAEEASFNGFQYHMKLVGIEEGEKASASDRQVCRGLVTTEEVSATGSQDLVSQVTAEEGDELSSMDQPTCLWHIKVEDDDACGIDQPACISQIKIEEEDVSIDEQACMRHIKVEEEAYAIGQQACIKPPMFGKDEAYANDEQTCASHLKMEEQMHAADQQASVSQVKTEGGMECSIRQTPAQDLMGLEECVGMEVEEGPSSVCYQNAIVQLISSKEGEMIGENGRYVLVKLAIAGGNTTSAREQQNLLTQVEMQREKSFVGELKNLVGHSNIDTKADPPGPCKIKKKEGPPCMDFHRPMNQEVAVAEQHTPWHLDEYTVYMDVEEGKEQLVSRDPLVQEGHMPSASPYNSSTVQECQLALSDDHNSSSHKDDEQSSSNECDLEFQDDEDLSDWEYHDWRNFVSNDPKDPQATAVENNTNQQSQSPPPERELSNADSLCFLDEEQQPGPLGLSGRTSSPALIVPTTAATTTTTINTPATTTTLTPATTTCAVATATINTAACNTVPGSVVTNTTTQADDAGDSVWVCQQPMPQVHVSRAGGRATGGQLHEDTETEAQATIERVLAACQQNQGQMGQVVEELRELRLLQRSMGTQMGQLVCLMGQLVGVLREVHAAQMTAQPHSSGQPSETPTTSAVATERGELQDNDSSDTSEPAAEAPPAKRRRGRPRNMGGSRGKPPIKAKSLSQH